ncbi:hypothetical protein ACFVWF_31230 [Rhodococcus qingshengii]|uniref:hypothetical protein n=1 Tax=Rhodococcus qingshengii TaxID=334542 RepID=UPI0036DEE8AF
MAILTISEQFEHAFIAAANAANDDPDDLDLSVDAARERIYLSNNFPGYCPYLRLTSREGDEVTVEICSITNIRPDVEGGEWKHFDGVEAAVAVNLSDIDVAAQTAVERWITTL